MSAPLIGAIEAGGTTIRCVVAETASALVGAEVFEISTAAPTQTLDAIAQYFAPYVSQGALQALGIASFGPIDLENSTIAETTPKLAWRAWNWRTALEDRLGPIRTVIDTDTNAALSAEVRAGSAQGANVAAYLTVGTGIGGSISVAGKPVSGLWHSEIGHHFVPRAPNDARQGVCSFHTDCLEGYASGAALFGRYGVSAEELLEANTDARDAETYYLAVACANLTTMVGAERIVLGGGVMRSPGLRQLVAERTAQILNNYLPREELAGPYATTIVAPHFAHSGLIGAWFLAEDLQ